MANISPIPRETALVESRRDPATGQPALTGTVAAGWDNWFVELSGRVDRSPEQAPGGRVALTTQGASIAATPIPLTSLPAGLYRVTYFARITRAATTSSSLTVTIGFTDGAVACTFAGSAMTGNTTATVQSGSWLLRSDNAGPITYATTYASVGATTMQYQLYIRAEAL